MQNSIIPHTSNIYNSSLCSISITIKHKIHISFQLILHILTHAKVDIIKQHSCIDLSFLQFGPFMGDTNVIT